VSIIRSSINSCMLKVALIPHRLTTSAFNMAHEINIFDDRHSSTISTTEHYLTNLNITRLNTIGCIGTVGTAESQPCNELCPATSNCSHSSCADKSLRDTQYDTLGTDTLCAGVKPGIAPQYDLDLNVRRPDRVICHDSQMIRHQIVWSDYIGPAYSPYLDPTHIIKLPLYTKAGCEYLDRENCQFKSEELNICNQFRAFECDNYDDSSISQNSSTSIPLAMFNSMVYAREMAIDAIEMLHDWAERRGWIQTFTSTCEVFSLFVVDCNCGYVDWSE
jgi:hypothetical protein